MAEKLNLLKDRFGNKNIDYIISSESSIEDAIKEHSSVTIALSKCGVTDYKRHSTAVKAVLADAVQSNHLRIKPGDPLLRTESVNTDLNGNPIEFGIAYFSGSVVTLNYT